MVILLLSSCSVNVVVQGVTVRSPQRICEPQQKRAIVGSAVAGYALAKHFKEKKP